MKPTPVSAVELMDRASLRSVENKPGMPDFIRALGPAATALLVETRAENQDGAARQHRRSERGGGRPGDAATGRLHRRAGRVRAAVEHPQGAVPVDRRHAPDRHDGDHRGRRLSDRARWPTPPSTCSGCSSSTATTRRSSSAMRWKATCTSSSPPTSAGRRRSTATAASWTRSRTWWSTTYDGSLKAEHGTGRNMAPFVELEWGSAGLRADARDQGHLRSGQTCSIPASSSTTIPRFTSRT